MVRELQARAKELGYNEALELMRTLLHLKTQVKEAGLRHYSAIKEAIAFVSRCLVCMPGDALNQLDLDSLDEDALQILVKDARPPFDFTIPHYTTLHCTSKHLQYGIVRHRVLTLLPHREDVRGARRPDA